MSKKTEKAKAEQLGMSPSGASTKLMKLLLFEMARNLGRDLCCRCGKKIETVKEFSIDHIMPWLHVDVALYWDTSNVAFSHRRCNCGHRRSRERKWDTPERHRARFKKYYSDPQNREKHLARQRRRYREKKALSANG